MGLFDFFKKDDKVGKDSAIDSKGLVKTSLSTKAGKDVVTKLSFHPEWQVPQEQQYVFNFLANDLQPLKPNQLSLSAINIETDPRNGAWNVKAFFRSSLSQPIELGEIETKVMAEEGISRACCLYDAKKKRILCFYTGTESTGLNEKLKESLPPFMVPNKFFYLEEMPMTKNGKIDRNVLKKTGGIA